MANFSTLFIVFMSLFICIYREQTTVNNKKLIHYANLQIYANTANMNYFNL